jgi:uncharacterized protein (TIGR02246 family)
MRRIAVRAVVLLTVIASVTPAFAATPKADPARASIEKIGKDFAEAYNRGDAKAVAAFYAEDAIVFPPESDMVKGRDAIQGVWKHALDTGIKSLEFQVVDVISSGNLAAETGIAVLHVQAMGSQESTVTVKYVVVWKKVGGSWKLYRDIWNSMAPPAAPMAAPPPPTTPH